MTNADSGIRRQYATTPHLIEMLDALFQGFRRRSPMALPEFVLHAESGTDSADDHVEGILSELGEELEARGVPVALVKPSPQDSGLGPRVRALRIVQELGGKVPGSGQGSCLEDEPWKGGSRQYGSYPFPRSKLLSTIEDVVKEQDGRADAAALLKELNSRGWRPSGTHWAERLAEAAKDASKTLPALLIAVVAVLIANRPWYITLAFAAALLAAVGTLSALPGKAPVFLGLRREIRWFLGTTYLNQGPRAERSEGRTWRVLHLWPPGSVRQRLGAVVRDIRDGGLMDNAEPTGLNEDAQRRHLQLRVHALREDLRDAHSAWAPDLRGRKRPTPPVLILPQADMDNGRIELIKAISDIRSIRSELDPMLVIAAVRQPDIENLQRSVTARRSAGGSLPRSAAELPDWYAAWNRARRVSQSPSLEGSTLPWVLRMPLPDRLLHQPDLGVGSLRRPGLSAGRPRWTWLWSLPALTLLLGAAGVGVVLRDAELGKEYCVGGLSGINRDSERVPFGGGENAECVGVATGTVTFPVAPKVQALIKKANEEIGDSDYVTIVYAGPLSGTTGELVKGAEELRGAYLAQVTRNEQSPVKLRILVANGGKDMYSQQIMAKHIVDLARRDKSIVGVVGMGRDMTDSDKVQDMFREAELPVVSGTNSGTYLAQYPNFFGLAATDKWQSEQLALIAQQLTTTPEKERAVVLARDPGESHDRYTVEQKEYGTRMLTAAGYRVEVLPDYSLENGKPVLDSQIADICRGDVPLALYFAGRSEDVTPLMNGIISTPACNREQIAVLAGDDLSRAGFATKRSLVAANVTLYHLTLTALEKSADRSVFYDRLANLPKKASEDLGLSPRATYKSEELADGQTALTHDATEVLYRAATRDGKPRGRAEAWANLRMMDVTSLATGRINFTVPFSDERPKGYAVSLVRVANPGSGDYKRTVLCARAAGDTEPLTKELCSIG